VKANEHDAKSPSIRTGIFAVSPAFVGAKGSGASSCHRAFLVVALAASVAALVFAAFASASAQQTRLYTGISFGPEGSAGSATFEDVQGVAVDQASGDVYVYDIGGGGKVYKFDDFGGLADFSGTATNAIGVSVPG
jgi:hypothetical protein